MLYKYPRKLFKFSWQTRHLPLSPLHLSNTIVLSRLSGVRDLWHIVSVHSMRRLTATEVTSIHRTQLQVLPCLVTVVTVLQLSTSVFGVWWFGGSSPAVGQKLRWRSSCLFTENRISHNHRIFHIPFRLFTNFDVLYCNFVFDLSRVDKTSVSKLKRKLLYPTASQITVTLTAIKRLIKLLKI